MNYIDIVIGGLVLYGAVKGFSKGLIVEAASLIALFLGLVGALLFSSSVGKLSGNYIGMIQYRPCWGAVCPYVYNYNNRNKLFG